MEKTVEVKIKFEWMDCCRKRKDLTDTFWKNVLEIPFEFLQQGKMANKQLMELNYSIFIDPMFKKISYLILKR